MSVYKLLSSTRLIDESNMYGRDADKQMIVKLLLSQRMGGNHLPMDVIAITGLGGMGKTTLAKLVYEDVQMKVQFEHRDWLKLKETLMDKKFFLVLDDVWNENHDIWDYFQAPLKHGAPQSYNIDKNVLIQLWMGNDLIDPTQKSMSLKEAEYEMFKDLESRSFFEPSRKGDDYFIMHGLVNNLAKYVTQEFLVRLEVD
ncbi:hypothetical protein K1719_024613 [Acacia pycnantha]|nr:hypothetical protein K1719_024613 [Acacia pycnantha]